MSYDLSNAKVPENYLEEMSAAHVITHIANELDAWKAQAPENSRAVLRLRTPEGKLMRIFQIRPSGYHAYVAIGAVERTPWMVTGHIAALSVSCSFEELSGEEESDFEIEKLSTVH